MSRSLAATVDRVRQYLPAGVPLKHLTDQDMRPLKLSVQSLDAPTRRNELQRIRQVLSFGRDRVDGQMPLFPSLKGPDRHSVRTYREQRDEEYRLFTPAEFTALLQTSRNCDCRNRWQCTCAQFRLMLLLG